MRRLFARRGPAEKKLFEPELRRPDYANRHEGRTAVVLGNGPSLATHRDALHELIASRDAIVLGANHVAPFIAPHYHAFTNRKRYFDYGGTVDHARSRLLVSAYFNDELVRLHHDGPYERIQYVNDNDAPFGIEDGIVQASGRTVSVLLIGVAIVMGFDEILVAGLDGVRPEADRLYHAETNVLKQPRRAELQEEVHAYTRRFLGEIQAWLAAQGRRPFALVTPTVYEEHFVSTIGP